MIHLIAILLGVFMGVSFKTTVYEVQLDDAVRKCAANGGLERIATSIIDDAKVTCSNGAKFVLVTKGKP